MRDTTRPPQFEKAWSKWLGCNYSLFVSSGSTANFLLVAAVKEKYALQAGSKVLVPACTWVTNVAPIMQLGLEPVFCDVELSTFSFDLTHMKQLREIHGDEIRAVFVTHLLGLNANVEAFKELFPRAIFMEDICESHGVTDERGVKRGAGSSVGATFSFYYGHHMTTVEGGMVSTDDAELYELMRLKRSHGMARELSTSAAFASACVQHPAIDPRFLFLTDGYNFRNTDLGAQLGLTQLERLSTSVRIRQENHAAFVQVLQRYDTHFYIPSAAPTNSSFCLPFICKTRALYLVLKVAMEVAGIETRPVVGGNLLRQPFLKDHAHVHTANADLLNEQGFYIGNNQFVTAEQVRALQPIIQECVDNVHG